MNTGPDARPEESSAIASQPSEPAAPKHGYLSWAGVALAAALAAAAWFAPAPGLTHQARAGLICLLFAVTLWSLNIVPKALSGLAVLAALLASGAASSFRAASVGFSSDPLYFLLAISLVGTAATRAGLAGRAGGLLLFLGRGRRAGTLWALSATLGCLALFMPTAAGRFQALRPVLDDVEESLGEPPESGFRKAGLIIAGVFGPCSSIGVMTGGGLSIVAAGLLNQQGLAIDWIQWLVAMLPIGWAALAIATWMVNRRYVRSPGRPMAAPAVRRPAARPLSDKEWWVIGALGTATLLWIGGGFVHLDPALPAILAALLLSLPGVGLIRSGDLARLDWNGLVMIGAALSLGDNLARGGLGTWLTAHVATGGEWLANPLKLLLLLLFALGLRVLIISPPACLSVLLPLLVHIAPSTAAALPLALAFTFAMGTLQPLPTHSPSSVVGFASGGYSVGDQLTMSLRLLPFTLALTLVAYYLYWPHLPMG